MARTKAKTVNGYLAELLPERREAIEAVRKVILDHLPDGFEETLQFGMIAYVIPLERYPETYNKQPLQYAALASQKNYMSLYLMNIYGDPETQQWFVDEYRASGKKLDMGKSCVRFNKLEDLPVDLIGEAIARTSVGDFIKLYEALVNLKLYSGESPVNGCSGLVSFCLQGRDLASLFTDLCHVEPTTVLGSVVKLQAFAYSPSLTWARRFPKGCPARSSQV